MSTVEMPAVESELQRALESARRSDPKHYLRARLLDISFRDPSEPGNGPNWYTITGHAAVTGQETVLADLGWLRIRERIAPGAFDTALAANPDVHLNINHDMKYAMARTGVQGVGGLSLSMDAVGLRTFAQVSTDLSFARDLAVQMKTGIIDQMSFAFTIANETRSEVDDGETIDVLYEINEVAQLFDVCVCAQGAYSQTDSNLHSRITAALGRVGIDPAVHPSERRALEAVVGSTTHVEPVVAVGVSERDKQLAAMRARARIALHTHQR